MTAAFQLSSPPTIHKPTGYSHLAEVTRGRLVYTAGQVAQDASERLLLHPDTIGELGLVEAVAEHVDPVKRSPARLALPDPAQLLVHQVAPAARQENEALRERVVHVLATARLGCLPPTQQQLSRRRDGGLPTQRC